MLLNVNANYDISKGNKNSVIVAKRTFQQNVNSSVTFF